MKKTSIAICVSLLALTGAAYAQNDTQGPTSEIRMTTDPAVAARVEQHAMEIQAQQQERQQQMGGRYMSSGDSGTMPHKATKHRSSRKHSSRKMQGGGATNSSGMSGQESGSGQAGAPIVNTKPEIIPGAGASGK